MELSNGTQTIARSKQFIRDLKRQNKRAVSYANNKEIDEYVAYRLFFGLREIKYKMTKNGEETNGSSTNSPWWVTSEHGDHMKTNYFALRLWLTHFLYICSRRQGVVAFLNLNLLLLLLIIIIIIQKPALSSSSIVSNSSILFPFLSITFPLLSPSYLFIYITTTLILLLFIDIKIFSISQTILR